MAEKTPPASHTAALAFIVASGLLFYTFVPPFGDYELRAGHAACPSKDSVVEYRGARMFGLLAKARVIAARKCVTGPKPVKVLRRSTFFDLAWRVEVDGRVMFADHDAIAPR